MSLFSKAVHVVAQPIGWSAEAGGALTGSNYLTNVGHAITNPNVVYTGGSLSHAVGNGPSFSYVPPKAKSTGTSQPTANQNTNKPGASTTTTQPTYTNPYEDPAYNTMYSTYSGQANTALGDLLSAYNTQNKALNSKYDVASNELQSGYNHAKNNYDDAVTQQNQDLLRQDNQVRQGVYNAYQNLMNLLGAYGGGGTSVALNWAPEAAQRFQNAQLGDASQNAATNLRSLNTTFGNYEEDFKNKKEQLADQRAQDLANNQSTYNQTRNQLNEILKEITNRAIDPSSIGSALSGIRAGIPNLKFVQPSYTGETPTYNAPNLSTFEASAPAASFASPASVSNSSTTPAIAYLLDQQRKQQPAIA